MQTCPTFAFIALYKCYQPLFYQYGNTPPQKAKNLSTIITNIMPVQKQQ